MPGDERTQETRLLTRLTTGEVELLGLMPNASNYTFLVRLRDADENASEGILAVYKPRAGETPLWDFPEGTLCLRETAAWEVSEALGWGLVPPTVLREGPHGLGSMQAFVPFDPDEHYFTLRETRPDDFARIAVFDAIINNADRKGGHCLLGHDGRIRCIDHGVCFHAEPKLRTVIWDFAGQPIPDDILEEVDTAIDDIGSRTEPLLDPLEAKSLADRIQTLLREGSFPMPGAERHYPWPPV